MTTIRATLPADGLESPRVLAACTKQNRVQAGQRGKRSVAASLPSEPDRFSSR